MRWEITVWIRAVLVVATSAQQLSIENDLAQHTKPTTTPPPANKEGIRDPIIIISEERIVSEQINSGETDAVSVEQPFSKEHVITSDNSSEKISSSGIYNVTRPDSKASREAVGGNDEGDDVDDDDENGEEDVADSDNQSGDNDETPGGVDNESEGNRTENESTGDDYDTTTIAIVGEPEPGGSDEAVGEGMIIETTTGPVRGHAWQGNTNIISYIDIQYGIFRSPFEPPAPPNPWENVHDVKEHTKLCPQLQGDYFVGDTDCLTLSIFTPPDVVNASVLVHIHEGNFTNGSANPAIYGPEYLIQNGIILVLPNYRLGALGFLCLQNTTAPGNAALKDLSLALSWIKANIALFGGNPENIAVSGDGTAGSLAGYLALSPMSKGNVTKVITESGSVLSHWALDRTPIVAATYLANRINGFQSWQDINISTLVTAAKDIALRPCLERAADNAVHFMVETPWTMIRSQAINITFMIGSAEFAGMHEYMIHTEGSIQQINDDVDLLLPNDLQFETSEERSRVGNQVKTQYFGETPITVSDVSDVARLSLYFTDAEYLGPGIRTARTLVNSGATVYFYEFGFVGAFNRELQAINQPVKGAVKGDIIGYLFTQDGIVPGEDTDEKRMIEQLIELWTTFLKTGTPSAEALVWNKLDNVSALNEEWLCIGQEVTMRRGLHLDRLSLWTDIYNQHFIERNIGNETSSCGYTVLILQFFFFIGFFRNASHSF